jgi:hypothetical protein
MLYLKIMSANQVPDDWSDADYTIFPIPDGSAVSFAASKNRKHVEASWFTTNGLQTVTLSGHAYLMNESGKTIGTRSANPANAQYA